MTRLFRKTGQDQSLIFLHIPKAAGTTLHTIIERQYEPAVILTIDGARTQESIGEFKKLPKDLREGIRVLKGHMYFGLHEFLPRPSTYITILRDPVDRVISNYYYVLRTPLHYLHHEVHSRGMSLTEYLNSAMNLQLDNGQTRLLSGVEGRAVGECSPEMLEIAKKNLQNFFSVVGLSERFDETVILLKKAFGWKYPLYAKANVTKDRRSKDNISKSTLNLIERYNELDIDLYMYARQMFEELISHQKCTYKTELRTFKILNKLYGQIYPLLRQWRHNM